MKELIGTVWKGLIIDENETTFFVQKNGITFHLDKSEGEFKIGDMVEGFGFESQKHDLTFTTQIPSIKQGTYGFATVVASRKDLGVFVDIGLPDKEVVVSLDELPEMRQLWPRKGDKLYVTLSVDEKDRLWANLADDMMFQAMAQPATLETMMNKDISGVAYRLKLVGSFIFTDENYIAFVHPSERFEEPRLGEVVSGRVIGVRPDGVMNISLKPRSHEVISSDAQMLLTLLERSSEGMLPFSDKSTPEEIKQTFAISKGQFKRAVGSLLKSRAIIQKDGAIYLVDRPDNEEA